MNALARGLLLALAAWVAALVAAPVAIASAHRPLALAAAAAYTGGALVCHQRPERSFRIASGQVPVCARCTGLYASALAGGIAALLRRRRGQVNLVGTRWALALAALPTAATWSLEYAGLFPFSNAARAIAALPLGLAAGWAVISLLLVPDRRGRLELGVGRSRRLSAR